MAGPDKRKLAAEFVGTFALVLAGCGAIATDAMTAGAVGHTGICLTFGLVVCVMIYATGHISGAHFNPAVTVAFAAARRFPWREVPAYVFSQCLAAITAIATLSWITGSDALGATVPALAPMQALALEALLSFFLMFVIIAVATDHRAVGQMAGVAIGGTVACCALFGGPLTGASMNPARTLGPALFSGTLEWMWLYLCGPIAGTVCAAWLYQRIQCDDTPRSDANGCC